LEANHAIDSLRKNGTVFSRQPQSCSSSWLGVCPFEIRRSRRKLLSAAPDFKRTNPRRLRRHPLSKGGLRIFPKKSCIILSSKFCLSPAHRAFFLTFQKENFMRIGILAESLAGEARVAATPETVKKMVAAGHQIMVQRHAGVSAAIPDADFAAAGAALTEASDIYTQAEILLKVRAPSQDELAQMKAGTVLIGLLTPHNAELVAAYARQGITAFPMEKLPRTTRAQAMDVLSSQANIAGYKAVIVAANLYKHFMPMLMTAAGTVKAARVVVLGVGVAGLQAIATAKRLGAIIEASDVRPAVKEQVESLGAKFIDVSYETDEEREAAQGTGGYARPMPQSWLSRQQAEVAKRVAAADIVITTALIPGRAAPVLVTEEMVKSMKPGSVIVDLAVEAGGNCPLTELNKVVEKHGVTLVGEPNLAGTVAADASALYARNLLNFLNLLCDAKNGGAININREDDIIAGTLLCLNGEVVGAKK
jgi:NAD(P) transhydrogenase subunit alpha